MEVIFSEVKFGQLFTIPNSMGAEVYEKIHSTYSKQCYNCVNLIDAKLDYVSPSATVRLFEE